MLAELPWQLWIILAEVWISALVASSIAAKPFYEYTWRNIWWAASDIGIIALLIWGGNPSWQHLLFGTLYAWAIFQRVRKTLSGARRERAVVESTGKPPPMSMVTFFLVLIAAMLTLLVATG